MAEKLDISRSKKYINEARKYIPGGVSSPVRAFKAVNGTPITMTKGAGAHLFDIDGNRYVDYVGSWGPLILGHADPDVTRSLKKVIDRGTSFGACVPYEMDMAKEIIKAVPSVEQVRFVNSGSEATAAAVRLSRGITGRNLVIKFDGCYHGAVDALLVKPGSGALTLGLPDTVGIPQALSRDTLSIPYNDIKTFERVIKKYHSRVACVILEPVAGNMGVITPLCGFLEHIRRLTGKYDIILIFDEVMSGFRVSRGGAQEHYSVEPDITTLGKIIGGGLPVGAVGGRKKYMKYFAPAGPVYQAGTLSGNPLAMTAGYVTLRKISKKNFYKKLDSKNEYLWKEIALQAKKYLKNGFCIKQIGGMASLFFTSVNVTDLKTAKTSNLKLFKKFFNYCLSNGVYFPPSQFEATFISSAHSQKDIDRTITVISKAFKKI